MLVLALAYVVTALVFVAMDMVWLTLSGPVVYRPVLGPLLSDHVDLAAAAAFYLVYIGGIVFFAVRPALVARNWRVATGSGVVLGLVAYATYDLTNQATLRLWSTGVTIADLCWGMVVSATAATAGYGAASRPAGSGGLGGGAGR